MNKDEVLEKSRKENKNADVFENEVLKEGGNAGAGVAMILATVFFVVQIFTGGGMNYGLYAVVFSITATKFIVKYRKLRKKHELLAAVFYTCFVVALSAAHIYQLVVG